MLKKISRRGRVALLGCAVAAISNSGCRSATPLNMFGWKSEPSAEALAGSGPTVTYPVPPSKTAKPQAIESIAAGVTAPKSPGGSSTASPSQFAGFDAGGLNIDTGQPESQAVTPAAASSNVNLAAARANGFYGQSGTSPYAASTGRPAGATPSGAIPNMNRMSNSLAGASLGGQTPSVANHAVSAGSSGRSIAPSYAMPSPTKNPHTSNPSSIAGMGSPTSPSPSATAGSFSLPAGIPSDFGGSGGRTGAAKGTAVQAGQPSASVASNYPAVSGSKSATESSAPATNKPAPTYSPGSTYAPGSTSATSGYPSGGYSPSTGTGSIYR